MRVQIAGIKTIKDALMCVKYDCDAIGLLVGQGHNSDDFISSNKAKEIINALPPFISSVIITHLEDSKEIIEILKETNANTVQLHSYIKESEVKKIKEALPYIKILRLIHVSEDGKLLNQLEKDFIGDCLFLDSINTKTNQFGGTGLTHDWNKSAEIVRNSKLPVILAGGLNPSNVKEAIKLVKPYGVDTNSGCKGKDGYRDEENTYLFIKNSKEAL